MIRGGHHTSLPYTDEKEVGAADFYFAINATFRFIYERFGRAALHDYWTDLGSQYYRPVTIQWQQGGLPAVAAYWRDFFSAEPAAKVDVSPTEKAVTLQVYQCPAIHHLRLNKRDIFQDYCQHCYFVSQAMAQPAGMDVRITGGNGTCRQTFSCSSADAVPQDFACIHKATSQ